MPKFKTHSGAKKRLTRTGTGKLKRGKVGKRHLNYGKGARRLRRLGTDGLVFAGEERRLNRLLPL